MSQLTYIAAALLVGSLARGDNSTAAGDTCGLRAEGPWSAALEDWVTAERVTTTRHGRIMALPPSHGYYVSERIDLMPPPPPPPHPGPHGSHYGPHHMNHRGPYPAYAPHPPAAAHGAPPEQHSPNSRLQVAPQGPGAGGPPGPGGPSGASPMPYDEWQATPPPPPGAGKIVNKPPNPYKDQFKPSYEYPPPSQPQPIPVRPGLSDRVDERPPAPPSAPQKQVSETDLYLLGAIEKLVYRVDLMEKRLRKMEENVHYLVVGTEAKPEACPGNFSRLGGAGGCYHVSPDALNWKGANYACRKRGGHLLELDADERRRLAAALAHDTSLTGVEFWTGGLNPGLLWIWSHSAQAVANATAEGSSASTVVGEGRCLAVTTDPARGGLAYRGHDCALRHRYVCERDADKTILGNEIERVARKMRRLARVPKMKWTEEDAR